MPVSSAWAGTADVASGGWNAQRRGDAYGRPATGQIAPRSRRSWASGVTVGQQQFRIGQGVRHPKFGDGTILSLSGSGQDAQAQIQFRDAGTKTLALGVAKLEVIAG